MKTILAAQEITKTFREGSESVAVLKGISLSLVRGEIVVMEGRSGSGKTTFLSIAGCILTPSSGRLIINDEEINVRHPGLLPTVRRRCIGFVFQQFNLFPALTALENIEFALNIKGIKGKVAHGRAENLLDAVGLAERKHFLPRDLSGGQKQRIAIARAIAGDPSLLLADEPTANLDTQIGEQILDLFRRLAKQEDRALLIVTHDQKVRAVADRVVEIQDGLLAA